jgi:hypothetical protein
MAIDCKKLIIKLPEKPASPYRKLSDGFSLYYKLTGCEIVKFKKAQRTRFRPAAVSV